MSLFHHKVSLKLPWVRTPVFNSFTAKIFLENVIFYGKISTWRLRQTFFWNCISPTGITVDVFQFSTKWCHWTTHMVKILSMRRSQKSFSFSLKTSDLSLAVLGGGHLALLLTCPHFFFSSRLYPYMRLRTKWLWEKYCRELSKLPGIT